MARLKLPALAWFSILYFIVLVLAMAVPPSTASLHVLGVNLTIYRLLIFTILIPYGLVWVGAFYAYDKLAVYSRKIAATREGASYEQITLGLRVLAWGLILSTMLSLILGLVGHLIHNFGAAQAIINRYVGLFVIGTAFIMIQNGSFELVKSVRARWSLGGIRTMIIAITVIGTFFLKLVADNQDQTNNPYHLSFVMLLLTVIIPYVVIWAIGVTSVYDLHVYAQKVPGVLYRRALDVLTGGLSLLILASIGSQYLTAAFARQSSFSLGSLLIVVYTLVLLQAAGLGLIAIGAQKLTRIEDV